MKLITSRLLLLVGLLLASVASDAQKVVLFSENFDNNPCVSTTGTCYASNYSNWTVTQPTANGLYPNLWFVSTNENGGGKQGTCGQRSNTSTNGTLHIASTADQYNDILNNYPALAPFFPCQAGDCGDTYFTGLGIDGSFVTDQMAVSPIINTQNTCFSVFLTFDYIEDGQDSLDNLLVEYSPDNGTTWSLLIDPPKTDTCPTANSGDGLWSKITVELPDSPVVFMPYKNYLIGFRWVNNDDAMGHDPAITIDSMLVYTTSAPDIGISPPPTLCAPANFVLSPTYADPYYTYVWTINGGTPFESLNPLDTVHASFPNPGNYTVSLSVSDYNSCGNSGNSSPLVVINCAQPKPAFTPTDTTICTNQCVNFINKSLTEPGNTQYSWTFNGGNPGTYSTTSASAVNPPTVCYSTAGTYQVVLNVTDVNGNTATATNSITVQVCNGPVPNFSFSPTTPCAGSPVAITNKSIHDTTCSWIFRGGTPDTSTLINPPSVIWATKGTYEIVLTVGDGNGDFASDSESITVDSCGTLTANFSVDSSICMGACIQYTDLTTGGQPPYTYLWSFEGGSPETSTQASPNFICYQNTGVDTVSLKVFDASGDSSILTKPGYITVYPLPIATVATPTGSDTISILAGNSIPLVATGGISYMWYPDVLISSDTAQNPTVSPVDTTVYIVTVTDMNGCTAQASVHVDIIPENTIFAPTLFTPNGDKVNDYFKVYIAGDVTQYELLVFDRWGTEIFYTNDVNIAWDGTFNGKQCTIGVYVWYYKVSFVDGKQFTGKGDVTLLR